MRKCLIATPTRQSKTEMLQPCRRVDVLESEAWQLTKKPPEDCLSGRFKKFRHLLIAADLCCRQSKTAKQTKARKCNSSEMLHVIYANPKLA